MARMLGEEASEGDQEVANAIAEAIKRGDVRSMALARSVHGHASAGAEAVAASMQEARFNQSKGARS